MQQDYINLINFLKENDESVRKDLETLKFGTEILLKDYTETKKITLAKDNSYNEFQVIFTLDNKDKFFTRDDIEKIIGNNLDYHHIMMYCENKKIKYSIFGVGYTLFKKRGKRIFLLHFDNTKPLNEQKSEVYKQLLDYFISIK